jgi:predicted nucleotidyltransferase
MVMKGKDMRLGSEGKLRIPSGVAKTLNDLVGQIVETVHPLRIILFGSVVRGKYKEGSDLDLLIVVSEERRRLEVAQFLYRTINNIKIPFDLVVANPSLLRKYAVTSGFVYKYALEDGKELYAA